MPEYPDPGPVPSDRPDEPPALARRRSLLSLLHDYERHTDRVHWLDRYTDDAMPGEAGVAYELQTRARERLVERLIAIEPDYPYR